MDDFDQLAGEVRAGSAALSRDLEDVGRLLRDDIGGSARSAGANIEAALRRAARSGRLEFEDLGRVAARALGEIAASALRLEGTGVGGLASLGTALLGAPGRATGGPVSPGRAYVVGERGPEIFVPTSSGRVETSGARDRPLQMTVNVRGAAGGDRPFMAQTGRQIAREIGRYLDRRNG